MGRYGKSGEQSGRCDHRSSFRKPAEWRKSYPDGSTGTVLFVLISVALLWYYSCTQIVKAPEEMESREMSGSQSRLERFAEYFGLTEREQEVLQLLLLSDDGMQEIADSIFVSRAMLYRHIAALNEKTGTRSRIGLIQFYYNWEENKK